MSSPSSSPHKNWVKTLVIRRVRADDAPFLREMLFEAKFWRSSRPRPELEEGLAPPELAKLLSGWGRAGDLALVATDGQGERIGAAWLRLWKNDDHTEGFVDEQTPELGVGVRRDFDAMASALRCFWPCWAAPGKTAWRELA